MIEVRNIKLSPYDKTDEILKKACKRMRVAKENVSSWKILKQSLDARKKSNIFYIYSACFEVKNEDEVLKYINDKHIFRYEEENETIYNKIETDKKVIVVGFGPGGMFAALTLAKMGFAPIVFERGADVDKRFGHVKNFWKTGELNPQSNVQFGEGGAGTFSDGKLTNRGKDKRMRQVFVDFVECGAPNEILYVHNPHIGTDLLRNVVKNIRQKIIDLGGKVCFESQVTDIEIENGKIQSVVINDSEKIYCDALVLAIGHSARDTFEMLHSKKINMSQKPFAMGVRIEHKKCKIDVAQFGKFSENTNIGPAEYKLTYETSKGRGVYTFCMCPGGYVVAAASEEGMMCVNGMSNYKRDGENSNSAVLVQIDTKDFGSEHPLAGMYFQRSLEKKAFDAGGGKYFAPAQRVDDFLNANEKKEVCKVLPTYKPGVKFCDLSEILPEFMCDALREGIVHMGKKLHGFDSDAILTAVESRSSSPVRIERDKETGESLSVKGIYPVGEGAGYAGGIVSAAVDGIKAAEKIYDNILNFYDL